MKVLWRCKGTLLQKQALEVNFIGPILPFSLLISELLKGDIESALAKSQPIKGMKKQPMVWKEIFTNHKSDNG